MNDDTPDIFRSAERGPPAESFAGTTPVVRITVVMVIAHQMVGEGLAAALTSRPDISVLASEYTSAGGLAAVARFRPDVLLMQQQLPDGLGTDALAAVLPGHPALKALLLTTDDSDEVFARAVTVGAAGVVSMTKRVADLVEAIRAAARNEPLVTADDLRRMVAHLNRTGAAGDWLTTRELEVFRLLAAGKSTSALAAALSIAPATARNHIQSIINKLGAHSRLEAVTIGLRENILSIAV